MSFRIRRNLVLKALDAKTNPDGSLNSFSMVFITKTGERIFLPRAIATGLPFSLKVNRMRGIMPVDLKGEKTGHPYPVNVDLILEFNSMEVIL